MAAADETKAEPAREPQPHFTVIIHRDGTVTMWCSEQRRLTGICPEGWEGRRCDECMCG